MTTSNKNAPLKVKPNWRFIQSHPVHFLSFGFGSGLLKAPGTWGTLVAIPIYYGFAHKLSDLMMLIVISALYIAGIRLCHITGEALGVPDYGGIVWDEIVAFMLVLFFTPPTWGWILLAFILFRFFDIVKPQPIRYFDQQTSGGFGVMFDDLLAAFYTLLCLALIKAFLA